MYSLQATAAGVVMGISAISISSLMVPLIGSGKSIHRCVRDVAAFDKTNPFEFWQDCEARDRLVGKMKAASEVDITNAVAVVDEAFDRFVRQVGTMTQVHIV